MKEQRHLAAIVCADVAGYSRMMAADEAGTLARLKAHRAALDPVIGAQGGRVVKTTGDGLLIEFPSVVAAVEAAVEAQGLMARHNAIEAESRRMAFRIGVHLGDVILDEGDIYGDGVNIAARLQEIAEPGGIAVSRIVAESVRGKLAATLTDTGFQALKNIPEPMQVFRVSAADAAGIVAAPSLSPPDRPSIAVLPFANMSGDAEQEYFADGVVEDIITELSRMRWLFVIARNSSFIYKGRAVDVKQVGRELGVRYVLEGSIRKAAGRIRLTGQLIDTASGAHVWADRYDGMLEDIFDLQDQITKSVVGAVAPQVEEAERERVRRKPTGDLGAYDLCLRASDLWLRAVSGSHASPPAALDEALQMLAHAIARDPNFAMAYADAAMCYTVAKTIGSFTEKWRDIAEARRLARKAVALGQDNAAVLTKAAWTLAYVVGDIETAADVIQQALSLTPNLSLSWSSSGWINVWMGRPEIGLEHVAIANRLSPLDPFSRRRCHLIAAHAHFFLGQFDDAIERARVALSEMPTFQPALRIGVASLAMAGRLEEAAILRERLQGANPHLRLSNLRDVLGPYRNPEHIERYAEGLRRAGLPE